MLRLRLSFALLWALMLHVSALLFWLTAPAPAASAPQGRPGAGVGLEIELGAVPLPDSAPPRIEPAAAAETSGATGEEVSIVRVEPQSAATAGAEGRSARRPGGASGDAYFARVRAHLASFRRALPPQAWRDGVAEVRFEVASDGQVTGIAIARSSGQNLLDEEAVALIVRASPLPAPPGGSVRLQVPIEFRSE